MGHPFVPRLGGIHPPLLEVKHLRGRENLPGDLETFYAYRSARSPRLDLLTLRKNLICVLEPEAYQLSFFELSLSDTRLGVLQ